MRLRIAKLPVLAALLVALASGCSGFFGQPDGEEPAFAVTEVTAAHGDEQVVLS